MTSVTACQLNTVGQTIPPYDLCGFWSGNYECDGQGEIFEVYVIYQSSDSVFAAKVLGDPCDNAGNESWVGSYNSGWFFNVTVFSGSPYDPNSTSFQGQVTVVDSNHLIFLVTNEFTRLPCDQLSALGIDASKYHVGCPCPSCLFIPLSFSPNNDGKNDQFSPIIQCEINNYQFTIYNRWGKQIFETNQLGNRWNGNYKGIPCELGVYVWSAQYSIGNSILLEKGNVTLVR